MATVSLMEIRTASSQLGTAVALRSQLKSASNDLSYGQAALYRAINLKSQNVEIVHIRTAKNAFQQSLDRAKASLASLSLSGLPIDTQLVPRSVTAFGQYASAADQAASFVEDDAFNATMFMTDAEQKYDLAMASVATLLEAAGPVVDTMQERMREVVAGALFLIPASAAVAVLLSVAATTWLSRLISRPITAMTASMRRLAEGDLETEVAAGDGKNEVAQMAKALLVFRINARRAHSLQAEADKASAAKARRQAAMDRHTNDFGTCVASVMQNLVRSAETMRGAAGAMSDAAHRTRAESIRTAEGAVEIDTESCRGGRRRGANAGKHRRDWPASRTRCRGGPTGG